MFPRRERLEPRGEVQPELHLVEDRGDEGGRPRRDALDAGSASTLHFAVGDRIRIEVGGPVRTFTVVGVARYGDVDTIGSATFAVFDVDVAKRLLHKSGYDAISVAAAHGWQQWEFLASGLRPGETTIRARAADLAGRVQPERPEWNRLGYGVNPIHEITVLTR